ncbi:DUF4180 domain-containing protein [Stackebrandtia nassauensis]|uniref:Alpha/beta hydrolase n=1 Tax=Stackebrandtia nassauensis (strain DSM 44728 / CIP 108903 / NRRL B-16338 / NBRC 102104 / LLR-40K-21) TaxID=446470 RepID=D3PX02_STANL|nr:DUF4180 domain-containing protein [Stackebrandtia nassauensis]ADD45226.1 alpha/beta hydrolase [Stackebrandtia nassauensis DSM 44728]
MTAMVTRQNGTTVLKLPADGPQLREVEDFVDLLGEAMANEADLVVIPADRIADKFFQLRSGLAGEVTQKFVNYRTRLVIIGDISTHTADSSALAAFVAESNRGDQLWFLPDRATLDDRLADGD